jgi:hypothetical protein
MRRPVGDAAKKILISTPLATEKNSVANQVAIHTLESLQ